MHCSLCSAKAVFAEPALCAEHFIERFEDRVKRTIEEHSMIPKQAKICVAASGGKDSMTTLLVLKRLGHDITALAVDEGIQGYREHTLDDLRRFCTEQRIPLQIVGFKELIGKGLDLVVKEHPEMMPCTVCGTFRRYLLNKHAHGYDIIATGHNADDEAQSILMNLFRANKFFTRPGPKTGTPAGRAQDARLPGATTTQHVPHGFVQRVKPLYFCTEKEIMTYALLNQLPTSFTECPYVDRSYRDLVRNELNDFAQDHPGVRNNILEKFLALRMPVIGEPGACHECGEPTNNKVCAACRMRSHVR